jgi:hypothetical protein
MTAEGGSQQKADWQAKKDSKIWTSGAQLLCTEALALIRGKLFGKGKKNEKKAQGLKRTNVCACRAG